VSEHGIGICYARKVIRLEKFRIRPKMPIYKAYTGIVFCIGKFNGTMDEEGC
jgi:hypothetical protein